MLATHRISKVSRPRPSGLQVPILYVIQTPFDSTRAFTWGSAYRWGVPRSTEKSHKGLHTRYTSKIQRQGKRESLECLNNHHLRLQRQNDQQQFLYARFASSWKRGNGQGRNDNGSSDSEDWYVRWEKQKRIQYEDFVKRVERDPYDALFGASNRWLGWVEGRFTGDRKGATTRLSESAREAPNRTISGHEAQLRAAAKVSAAQKAREDLQSRTKATSPVSSSSEEELEYYIDPITLRKVPRQSQMSHPPAVKYSNKAVNIPVRAFAKAQKDMPKPSRDHSARDSMPRSTNERVGWLEREHFKARANTSSNEKRPSSEPRPLAEKMESSLDRHLKQQRSHAPSQSSARTEYQPIENKKDDVDLLRASDIRAAAGRFSPRNTETAVEKNDRLKSLEAKHRDRTSELDERLAKEVTEGQHAQLASLSTPFKDTDDSNHHSSSAGAPPASKPGHRDVLRAKLVPTKIQIDLLNQKYSNLRRHILVQTRRRKEAERKKATLQAHKVLQEEIQAQKAAMQAVEEPRGRKVMRDVAQKKTNAIPHEELHGEGDMASNVHEFADRSRWYKRKAPHAQSAADEKVAHRLREKDFVRTIRDIYEDTYGIIDTKHRQAVLPEGPDSAIDAGVNAIASARTGLDKAIQGLKASTVLPIEKAVAAEFQSLQFMIEETRLRLANETDQFKKDEIAKELVQAREDCARTLEQAGRSISCNEVVESCPVKGSEQRGPLAEARPQSRYLILAYDAQSGRVVQGKEYTQQEESSMAEKTLSIFEALNKVKNPGRFLPLLMPMHHAGYAVVCASSDILVVKKVHAGEHVAVPDEAVLAAASDFAFKPEPDQERESIRNPAQDDEGRKIRRQEVVFSGSPPRPSTTRWSASRRYRDGHVARRGWRRYVPVGFYLVAAVAGVELWERAGRSSL